MRAILPTKLLCLVLLSFLGTKAQQSSNAMPSSTNAVCNLAGIYSVGNNGNFTSLTAALDSIKLKGLGGNVVLELTASYSSATETFPISFPKNLQVPCLGNNSVTVRPAGGVSNMVINGASNNTVLLLDSVNYLTIDGRPGGTGTSSQLTIINNNASPVLRLVNASGNKLLYLKMGGGNNGATTLEGVINLQGSKGTGCDNNKLEACEVYSVNNTPASRAVLFQSSGLLGYENNNDSIINCNFYNFSRNAINLGNYNDGWKIRSNSFYNTTAIDYEDGVSILKINTLYPVERHSITQNHFGGTGPGGSGSPMNIDYKTSFYCIDVAGSSDISNNYFTRMKFVNTSTLITGSEIRLINVSGDQDYGINDNQFGSLNAADSLHFSQTFADNNVVVGAIMASNMWGQNDILFNAFNHFRCYSEQGSVTLRLVSVIGGSANIYSNVIGHPNLVNSIVNNSPGETYGIYEINALTKINGNMISRISSTSTVYGANVWGIYVAGVSGSAYVDSVCNNTIFHLRCASPGASSLPLVGISVNATAGGSHGLIADNVIHSLHNTNTDNGSVTGLFVSEYLNLRRNLIHSLNTSATATTYIYGILVKDKESSLENNMVSLGLDSTGNSITAGNLFITGISGGHDMRHNSVYIGGSNVGTGFGGSYCYEFFGNALPTVSFNNIFHNARSNASPASTNKHQCAAIDISYSCNSNLYYFDGNGGIMGTFQGVRYNDFAQWKSGTGKDVNSLFTNPGFVSPAPVSGNFPNLHLNFGSPAEAAGDAANTVATDFDQENRNSLSPVDIGADAGDYGNCPIANAGFDALIFEGASIQLGAPPLNNVTYSWTSGPPGFTSALANPVVTPSVSTQYILTVTRGLCTSRDTVFINVMTYPPLVLCPGGSTAINAQNTGTTYQWQVNTGTGYLNLVNDVHYAGVNSNTLQLINIPSSYYGYKYRCMVDGNNDVVRTLKFEDSWTGAVNNLWNNPANWSCGVVPDGNTDVYINSGIVVLNANGFVRTIYLAPGVVFTVNNGFILTVTH